ncbi:hypothetical protein [Actinocrispum sp. NPDC049592]|uniref:Rv0361 family membrane protein n=1 Tax=Actinocrispum sp. NPDC049592 TaxID=3154835 RepID=UPI0034301220
MSRKNALWIAGGAVAVVAAVVVTVLLLVGSSTPTDVAGEWVNAASQGDVATVKQVSCDKLVRELDGGKAEALQGFADGEFDLTNERIDGDHAEVFVTNRMTQLPRRFTLVKESGWKVCEPFTIDFRGPPPAGS